MILSLLLCVIFCVVAANIQVQLKCAIIIDFIVIVE